MMHGTAWGYSLHLDLHNCNPETYTKENLKTFCTQCCEAIHMKPYGNPMVEEFGEGDLFGLSALQFIETSSLAIHTDNTENRVFLDIFSCKYFDQKTAIQFSEAFFQGKNRQATFLERN